MASKNNAPRVAIVAESKQAAQDYADTHALGEDDVYVLTPSAKSLPTGAAVSRVKITRGMVRHADRSALVGTARAAVPTAE